MNKNLTIHRLRGHDLVRYRVDDAKRPWRWQCSCGEILGGDPKPPIDPPPDQLTVVTDEGAQVAANIVTDIVQVIHDKAPTEAEIDENTLPGRPAPEEPKNKQIKEWGEE